VRVLTPTLTLNLNPKSSRLKGLTDSRENELSKYRAFRPTHSLNLRQYNKQAVQNDMGQNCWWTLTQIIGLRSYESTPLRDVYNASRELSNYNWFQHLYSVFHQQATAEFFNVLRLYRTHEMQTILTDVRGVCLSVTRLKSEAAGAVNAACRKRGVIRCNLRQMSLTSYYFRRL